MERTDVIRLGLAELNRSLDPSERRQLAATMTSLLTGVPVDTVTPLTSRGMDPRDPLRRVLIGLEQTETAQARKALEACLPPGMAPAAHSWDRALLLATLLATQVVAFDHFGYFGSLLF